MMSEPVDGIRRELIESSNLVSIGYSEERRVLAVEFKPKAGQRLGLIMHYGGISRELATEFYCAESAGGFYSKHIRGKFPAMAMTGPCSSCGANGIVGLRCASCNGGQHYRVERRPEPATV